MILDISLSEGCFGPNVNINGQSLFKSEYDTRSDEEVESLKQTLIDEISQIKSELDMNDWLQISQILLSRSNKFISDENSYYTESCEQCGNYNWGESYTKIDDINEGLNN